jgi:hypothetical protein
MSSNLVVESCNNYEPNFYSSFHKEGVNFLKYV